MEKQKFEDIIAKTRNQLLLIVRNENFYINLQKRLVLNELGVIAVNERTGTASIVFFNDIDAVISDSKYIK